ncbi:hypothetical protein Tco_1480524, partial [Tanacetum coccineum]
LSKNYGVPVIARASAIQHMARSKSKEHDSVKIRIHCSQPLLLIDVD